MTIYTAGVSTHKMKLLYNESCLKRVGHKVHKNSILTRIESDVFEWGAITYFR